MRLTNPEAIVPGLKAARDAERFARQAAFAGLSLGIVGLECVQLTPRHRLELEMVRNAFSVGKTATAADVFQFLWRLSPAWRRGQPITIASTLAWWRIHRVIYTHDLGVLERAIVEYLEMVLQDLPEAELGADGDSSNPAGDYVSWMACEVDFFMRHYHMTFEEYRNTPCLVLQQLFRAYRLASDPDVMFINASDKLVSAWARRARRENTRAE